MLYGLNGSKFGARHMTNTSGRILFDNANQAKAIDPAKVADMLNDLWSTSQNSLLPTIIKPSSSRFEGSCYAIVGKAGYRIRLCRRPLGLVLSYGLCNCVCRSLAFRDFEVS